MKHYNEEPLLKFFQKRFPSLIILFESNRGVFTIDQDSILVVPNMPLEEVLRELEEELPLNPLLTDLNGKYYHELWESFAQSQIIQGRNFSKQVMNLSKRWRKTVAEDKSPKKLNDFL